MGRQKCTFKLHCIFGWKDKSVRLNGKTCIFRWKDKSVRFKCVRLIDKTKVHV